MATGVRVVVAAGGTAGHVKGCRGDGADRIAPMARIPQTPDRNFSSNGDPEEPERDKRTELKISELFDDKARERFGRILSAAVVDPKKPRRRK